MQDQKCNWDETHVKFFHSTLLDYMIQERFGHSLFRGEINLNT